MAHEHHGLGLGSVGAQGGVWWQLRLLKSSVVAPKTVWSSGNTFCRDGCSVGSCGIRVGSTGGV